MNISLKWLNELIDTKLSKEANEQMRLANQFGYHTGNTIKRDWGKLDEHNETFKKLIGKENFGL